MATAVSVAKTNNPEIDGLLGGTRWTGTITYSFPDSPGDYSAGYSSTNEPNTGFSQALAAEQAAINYAVGLILSYTTASIQFAGANSANIQIAQSSAANPTSYAYYPSNSSTGTGGDVWFGTAYNYSLAKLGNYYFATALHELGHAVGLKHSQETGGVANVAVPAAHDDSEFTVMSYRSYVGAPLTGYTAEAYGYPQTYMANDILALQTLYGANFSTHNENTTYSWDSITGQEFVNGVAQLAPGGGAGGSANHVFMTVWDGGGVDTYDLSNYTTAQTIDLNPGASSISSAAELAYLGNGHYAQGNIFNAYLYNNDSRSYIENAIAGSGNDSITGNAFANHLDGGAGNDTLFGLAGDDSLHGGAGNDMLYDNEGDDWLYGDAGTNALYSGSGDDHLYGGAGNNTLLGEAGNDALTGGDSASWLDGGDGFDVLYGGAGDDMMFGRAAGDVLYGGAGNDTLYGNEGDDLLYGDAGTNALYGGSGDDHLYGGTGNNTLLGEAGNDALIGGDSADWLDGREGFDALNGGAGNDILIGGSSSDRFDFAPGCGADTIMDFAAGAGSDDKIDLSAFAGLTLTGVLNHTSQIGADAVIDLGNGHSITLRGVNKASLDIDDFTGVAMDQAAANPQIGTTADGWHYL